MNRTDAQLYGSTRAVGAAPGYSWGRDGHTLGLRPRFIPWR